MSSSSKPDSKGRENNKKAKQRRKRRSGNATPVTNPSGTSTPAPGGPEGPSTSIGKTGKPTGFDGEDYIEFTFSDPSDDEGETNLHIDAKGKGKGREFDGEPSTVKSRRDEGQEGEPGSRKRDRDEGGDRDPLPPREREWDRGKRGRGERDRVGSTKQYEMVFEFDDLQRFDPHSSKKAPWVVDIDWDECKNVAEMLHREVDAFVKWISPSPVEDEIRGLIVAQISNAIKDKFPDAKVLPFGSYETKLYLPGGDIDLVIMSDSMAYSDKVTVLHALANTLKRSGVTSRVSIIAKAKVPIVKFISTHGRFNVDISVNQSNGLLAGKIINGFLKNIHPRGLNQKKTSVALRSLIMITKAFLAQRSMNEVYTGGLGSYSIVCLAVNFLQMHPKIRNGEIDPEQNLGVLVMEFFELYGILFNYDEVGISLREGGTYFNKRQRGWLDYGKRGMLSVEDPADPSNDISKGSFGFPKVRTAFAGAHSILTSTAYIRAGTLHSRRSGRSVHLRDRYEPEDLSILSTVMGITQETINHRRLVQEIYDDRTLHDILGVKPRPKVQAADYPVPGRSSPEIKIKGAGLQKVWNEEDTLDFDEGSQHDLDDDEDGRYGIGQPPRKRQRFGNQDDYHTTTFVTDDDDETEAGQYSSEEDDRSKKRPAVKSRTGKPRTPEERERNRDYWLSKGIGFGEVEDSD